MKDEHPYSCDICNVKQNMPDSWYVVYEDGMAIDAAVIVVPWSIALNQDSPGVLHVCGITCAIRAVNNKLQEGICAKS